MSLAYAPLEYWETQPLEWEKRGSWWAGKMIKAMKN